MVEHHGEFYDFAPLQLSPVPDAPVPIWGGGSSEPALRRAATRFDGWASEIQTRAELAEIASRLRAWRDDSPRAGRPFGICAAAKDAFEPEHYAELAELGVTQLITVPWLFYGASGDELGPKLEGIQRFGEEVIAAG
jgi:alkanesulfonate monooxygenase SsuD/methylene tetrahydromethanopterin reductase-like flavin-dependent oxidoreductase (luciferase family)